MYNNFFIDQYFQFPHSRTLFISDEYKFRCNEVNRYFVIHTGSFPRIQELLINIQYQCTSNKNN